MSEKGASVTTGPYETFSKRLAAGERLTATEIADLAAAPDILSVGMLADEARRRLFGSRVTFARVAVCAFDKPLAEAVPLAAREVRLTGVPPSLEVAEAAVRSAKAVAGDRLVSGFSAADLVALGERSLASVLTRLRDAGLERPGEIPVDKLEAPREVVQAFVAAGFTGLRLTLARPPAGERVAALQLACDLCDHVEAIEAINPLPLSLAAFRPTTGYEDVKMVALARLAAPPRVHVQVDWLRYGPKLAQVALTFGADDLDAVSPSDAAPDGRRRAPLEEVRRNIEGAGFEAAERGGRFTRAR